LRSDSKASFRLKPQLEKTALEDFASALEQVLHKGAQDMLQVAIEIESQVPELL